MNTINNNIPFVPENTNDPAAGLNLSINQIDALLQARVQSVGANTPPTGAEGERHIVGTAPTGAWLGQANKLARFLSAGWQFYDARMVMDTAGLIYLRPGTTWTVGKQLSTEDYTSAEKAKLGGVATGATANSTDAQLRDRATHTGTQASSTISDFQAAAAAAAPVQDDDARLTDAREWTAAEVSQAEAEAGTATTARKWTALRVRQAVAAWWNSISSAWGRGFVASADAAAPFTNIMPDSGRFAGKMNPLSLGASDTFAASSFFSAINGSTMSSAGKFIFNNSTFGGSSGALTASVQSLIAALGRTGGDARYGVEFHVCKITAGTGTAAPSVGIDSVTRYLLTTNNNKAIAGSSGFTTTTFWIRAVVGSAHFIYDAEVNGEFTPSLTPVPAGWHHIRMVQQFSRGYDSGIGFPSIRATINAEVEIALPAFFTGSVDTGIHTAPLPNINELSA